MDVKVKICGITNVPDGLAAAEAGADAIGFILAPGSPRQVTIDQLEKISAALPPFLMRVGVFVDAGPSFVAEALERGGLTMAQFHGAEPPDFCLRFGVMTMKAFRVQDAASLEPAAQYHVDALLLDSYTPDKAGGSGAVFNWDLAVDAKKFGRPIFLAGGLTPDNVAQAVQRVRPFGVDVSSGVESAPGKKDHDKLRRFIAAARAA